LAADIAFKLGDVQCYFHEYEVARQHYEDALAIYRSIDSREDEAKCLESLGDLHNTIKPRQHSVEKSKRKSALFGLRWNEFALATAMGIGIAAGGSLLLAILTILISIANIPFISLLLSLLLSLLMIPLGAAVGTFVSKGAKHKQSQELAILAVICYLFGSRIGVGMIMLVFGWNWSLFLQYLIDLSYIFSLLKDPSSATSAIGLIGGSYYAYRYAR